MPVNDLPDDLMELARRIVDGEEVDWQAIGESSTEARPELSQLEALDRIRRGHGEIMASDLPFEGWGPLELREHLASGGFGEVYLAHDRNLDRAVALKLLHEEGDRGSRTRFVEEARRLAQVNHPNVVTVHGIDRFEGRLGIWMERIEGATLDRWSKRHGRLSAQETAVIGIDLCRALAAIHAAGLIHGDVKLANVMRARGGRIVLMDFGSSSRRSGALDQAVSGTPAYLAPEVVAGGALDPRADLFALGVLLYRLVGGDYPFPLHGIEPADDHTSYRPMLDLHPDLPAGLVRIVERTLQADPDARFASAGELEQALAGFLGPAVASGDKALHRGWVAGVILIAVAVVALSATRTWWSAPLEAEAEFFRWSALGTEERLSDGARTEPGDSLFLELSSESPVWAYVVNADSRGEEFLLYPVAGLDLSNPIPAGTHRIPGSIAAERRFWEVTSAGGRESLLLIVSREPVSYLERRIADLQPSAAGLPIPMGPSELAERMRGIGGLNAAPESDAEANDSIAEIRRRVLLESGRRGGVRVWELILQNSGSSP